MTNGSGPNTPTSPSPFGRDSRRSTDQKRHSIAQSPFGAFRNKLKRSSSSSSDADTPLNRDGEPLSKNQLRKHERMAEKEVARKAAEERESLDRQRKLEAEKRAEKEETQEQKKRYGVLPVNNYAGEDDREPEPRTLLLACHPSDIGKSVIFRARIHNIRKISAHLTFIELRQRGVTVQGVLHESDMVSQHMIYWVDHLHVNPSFVFEVSFRSPKQSKARSLAPPFTTWRSSSMSCTSKLSLRSRCLSQSPKLRSRRRKPRNRTAIASQIEPD